MIKIRKLLRFTWNGKKFQFCTLPQGLSCSPRVFTKILKPVYASLRKVGHSNIPYIDDSLLKGKTYFDCKSNIEATVKLVDKLGFTIHPLKSVFTPVQVIVFLGFIINSINMTVRLTMDRVANLQNLCLKVQQKTIITIREFATLIGKMVASEPGMQYAPLYYRDLEHIRDNELKLNRGNFDAKMKVGTEIREIIQWWIDNLEMGFKPIVRGDPLVVIHSDSSMSGWGGVNNTNGCKIEGVWNDNERNEHINYLELKAAFLTIKSLAKNSHKIHLRIYMDNTVAVSYINKLGGKIKTLHTLAKEIWCWCISKDIWLSAAHVPGIDNFEADRLSRNINDDAEWMLHSDIFHNIEQVVGRVDIDLFASRLNHQKQRYVSYQPDKNAMAIDAFSISWKNKMCYLFPPFSMIGRAVQKLVMEKLDRIILVAPIWTTQVWFAIMLHQICGQSYILPENSLVLPQNINKKHPVRNLRLGVFNLSGNALKVEEYQKTLVLSSSSHGVDLHVNNMGRISKDGCLFQIKGKLMRLIHLPNLC